MIATDSLIPDISIAPLQVHYEALPTTALYCIVFSFISSTIVVRTQ